MAAVRTVPTIVQYGAYHYVVADLRTLLPAGAVCTVCSVYSVCHMPSLLCVRTAWYVTPFYSLLYFLFFILFQANKKNSTRSPSLMVTCPVFPNYLGLALDSSAPGGFKRKRNAMEANQVRPIQNPRLIRVEWDKGGEGKKETTALT